MKFLPNLLTSLRIILILPYAYFLQSSHPHYALAVFVIAAITDGLDGYLARVFAWTSKVGAFLDPLADKMLMMTSFVMLGSMGLIHPYVVSVLILRDLAIIVGVLCLHDTKQIAIEPIMLSKINTALQVLLVICLLFSLTSGYALSMLIYGLTSLVLITSILSLWQYFYISKSIWAHE